MRRGRFRKLSGRMRNCTYRRSATTCAAGPGPSPMARGSGSFGGSVWPFGRGCNEYHHRIPNLDLRHFHASRVCAWSGRATTSAGMVFDSRVGSVLWTASESHGRRDAFHLRCRPVLRIRDRFSKHSQSVLADGGDKRCDVKRLAGKRWFYALGQRSASIDYAGPWPTKDWVPWARAAFYGGHEDGRFSNAMQTVKTWPISKLVESVT